MITFPNCKINIGLHVTEKRSDGFHNIETVMVPAGWEDILEIIPSDKQSNEAELKSTGIRMSGAKETNLCIKAFELLAKDFPLSDVRIHLHKMIPIGAGLGGGSSDAASMLIMLNKIFKLNLGSEQLEAYASRIGSDCAFFVQNRPVYATGKGDVFEPLKLKLKNIFCVIVKPKVHVSTPLAYSWIKPRKRNVHLPELIRLPLQDWKDSIENDFEKPLFEKFPTIKNIKSRLYKQGAVYASVSGSGSSVYGLFNEERHLDTYFRSCQLWSGFLS